MAKHSFRLWFSVLFLLAGFSLLLFFYYKQYAKPLSLIPTSGFTVTVGTENNLYPERIYYEVHPGDSVHNSIIVKNYFEHPITLRMEPGDAISPEQNLHDPNYAPRPYADSADFGRWTNFTEEKGADAPKPSVSKLIEARTGEMVDFEVSIPEDTPLGDYFGVIMGAHIPDRSAGVNAGVVSVIQNGVRAQIKVTDTPSQDIVYYDVDLSAGIMERGFTLIGLITLFALIVITFSQTKLFNNLFKS